MFQAIRQYGAAHSSKSQYHGVLFPCTLPMSSISNVESPRQKRSFLQSFGATRSGGKLFFQNFSMLPRNRPLTCIKNVGPLFRMYHSTTIRLFGLEEFRDTIPRQQRQIEPVGRSWSAVELRRKSYDDLHKLWYVLYKERNMLLTEQQLSRRKGLNFPQPERIKKVRKSMGAIKHVLGERKREHLSQVNATRKEGTANDDSDEPLPQSA